MSDYKLSKPQQKALATLSQIGLLSATELAKQTGQTVGGQSRSLRPLIKAGLVLRISSHNRRVFYRATTGGEMILSRLERKTDS